MKPDTGDKFACLVRAALNRYDEARAATQERMIELAAAIYEAVDEPEDERVLKPSVTKRMEVGARIEPWMVVAVRQTERQLREMVEENDRLLNVLRGFLLDEASSMNSHTDVVRRTKAAALALLHPEGRR